MAVGVASIPNLLDVITTEYGSHRNGSDRALSGRGLIPGGGERFFASTSGLAVEPIQTLVQPVQAARARAVERLVAECVELTSTYSTRRFLRMCVINV